MKNNFKSVFVAILITVVVMIAGSFAICNAVGIDIMSIVSGGGDSPILPIHADCEACNDTGLCRMCEDGIRDCDCKTGSCDFCDGTGRSYGGTYSTFGRIENDCSFCKGTGRHLSCNGNGYRSCGYCSGSGLCRSCR